MLSKRIISCLDIRNGNLAKSVKFVDTLELGDPVAVARAYYAQGIDELVFYDIDASHQGRGIMLDVVSAVAAQVFIPFSVGGGLATLADCNAVRMAGAEKINVNSAAVARPQLISEIAKEMGSQCAVLSMDVLDVPKSQSIPSGYEVVTHGGRNHTGLDAIIWARRAQDLGAGEIVVNSIDADGTKEGFHIPLTRAIADAVGLPVVASGGGGTPEHIYDVLTQGHADAALVASILHYNTYTIHQIKSYLHRRGLPMRM